MDDKSRSVHDKARPTMLAGPVVGTILFALSRGVPMERITEVTGLVSGDLTALDTRLPERHMPALWRLLEQSFPGQAIALDMAASVPMSFFGLLGHATRYCDTLQAAFEMLVRFRVVMSTGLDLTLVRGPEESRLEFFHPLDEDDHGHASEMGLGVHARFIREIFEVDDAIVRVEMAHEPFGPPAAYREFFRAPVVFEAVRNALVVRSPMLDLPLPERNAPMMQYVMAHLEQVRERQMAQDISDALTPIREAIMHNAERGEYGAEALAQRLGTTLRTLQRRVREQDTSLRDLIDQVREANARQLLGDRRLSLGEVAFLLGYSTDSSFRRAFKRWTGLSPQQARLRAS